MQTTKTLMGVYFLLLSVSGFTQTIPYYPSKDFSEGQFDLQVFLIEAEKPVIDPDIYQTCCNRFDQVTSWMAGEVTEEQLKKFNMRDLVTCMVLLVNQKREGFFCPQIWVLSAFAEEKATLDCDTICETVYVGLFKLQKKFPHYQILGNFRLVPSPGHVACMVVENGETWRASLQDQEICFRKWSSDVQENGLFEDELLKGEEMRLLVYGNLGMHYAAVGNIPLAKEYFEKVMGQKNGQGSACLQAIIIDDCIPLETALIEELFKDGKYEEVASLSRGKFKNDQYSPDFLLWFNALDKLGRIEEALEIMETIQKGWTVSFGHLRDARMRHTLAKRQAECKKCRPYVEQALSCYKWALEEKVKPYPVAVKRLRQEAFALGQEKTAQFEAVYEKYRKALKIHQEESLSRLCEYAANDGLNVESFRAAFRDAIDYDEEAAALLESWRLWDELPTKGVAPALKLLDSFEAFFKKHDVCAVREALTQKLYTHLAEKGSFRRAEKIEVFLYLENDRDYEREQALFQKLKEAVK